MIHNDIKHDLKAYVDNELPSDRMRELEDAIARDPQLAEEVQFMRLLSRSLQAMRGPEPAPFAADRIASRVGRRRLSLVKSPWLWAATTVLILTVLALPYMLSVSNARIESVLSEQATSPPRRLNAEQGLADVPSAPSAGKSPDFEPAPHTPLDSGSTSTPETYSVPDRQVILEGSIHLKVSDVKEAEKSVRRLVSDWRGFVQSSSSSGSQTESPRAVLVVRVPQTKFEEAMEQFEKLGEKISSNTSGDDVTTQMVDLDARIRTMKAQEETYRRLLGQAKTVGQVIEVQDRLSEVRAQIESLEAQLKTLRSLTSLSTITVTLEQRPKTDEPSTDTGWASDAWANAVRGLKAAWQAIATSVIFLFVYAPIWIPAGLILYFFATRIRRR